MSRSNKRGWVWLLAIQLAAPPAILAGQDIVRLTIELADSTLLKGTTTLRQLFIHTALADLDLPVDRITSVTKSADPGKFVLQLSNGDELAGELRLTRLDLAACFGSVEIPLEKVTQFKVAIEQEGMATFDAAADFSAEQNPTGAWSYGWCAQPAGEFHIYQLKSKPDARYPGLSGWTADSGVPSVAFNGNKEALHPVDTMTFKPNQLGFHPGPGGEYSVIRWTAPKSGRCQLAGSFTGLSGFKSAPATTTDVAIYHGPSQLFSSAINLQGKGNQADFNRVVPVEQGEVIDFVLGFGNGNYGFDSTGLDAQITLSPYPNNRLQD